MMNAIEETLGVKKVTDPAIKDAAIKAGVLSKIGKSYYIDPKDIGKIIESCRVQRNQHACTEEPTMECGSSLTVGNTSAQVQETVNKLKRRSPRTSQTKPASIHPIQVR
jgi:hypothetical protein